MPSHPTHRPRLDGPLPRKGACGVAATPGDPEHDALHRGLVGRVQDPPTASGDHGPDPDKVWVGTLDPGWRVSGRCDVNGVGRKSARGIRRAVGGQIGLLHEAEYATGLGDEGGFAPDISTPEDVLRTLVQAITDAGCPPGRDGVAIAMDPASSEFYRDGAYQVAGEALSSADMIDRTMRSSPNSRCVASRTGRPNATRTAGSRSRNSWVTACSSSVTTTSARTPRSSPTPSPATSRTPH